MTVSFERFTERARQVILLAHQEARDRNHAYIEIPHLIVGLLREGEGLGATTLRQMGVTEQDVSYGGCELADTSTGKVHSKDIPFRPRTERALHYALREALASGCNYIGTEHLLLGVVRAGEGMDSGLPNPGEVRRAVMGTLTTPQRSTKVAKPSSDTVLARLALQTARSTIDFALDELDGK